MYHPSNGAASGALSCPEAGPWTPWVCSKFRNQVSCSRGQEDPGSAIIAWNPGSQSHASQ